MSRTPAEASYLPKSDGDGASTTALSASLDPSWVCAESTSLGVDLSL